MAKLILNGETPKVYVSVPSNPKYEKRNASCFNTYYDSSMNISPDDYDDHLIFTWNGSTHIGTCAYYRMKLDKSIYKKVKVKITTGSTAYSRYSEETYWAVCGIRSGSSGSYIGYTTNNWIVKEGMNELNRVYEFEFDLDNIEDANPYFYIAGGGWNMVVTDFILVRR